MLPTSHFPPKVTKVSAPTCKNTYFDRTRGSDAVVVHRALSVSDDRHPRPLHTDTAAPPGRDHTATRTARSGRLRPAGPEPVNGRCVYHRHEDLSLTTGGSTSSTGQAERAGRGRSEETLHVGHAGQCRRV